MSFVLQALPNSFWVLSPTSPFRLKCCSRLVSVLGTVTDPPILFVPSLCWRLGFSPPFFWGDVPHWPLASFDLGISSCDKGWIPKMVQLASSLRDSMCICGRLPCGVQHHVFCDALLQQAETCFPKSGHRPIGYSRQARSLISLQEASAPSAENCCGACALAHTWINASLLPNWLQV